MSTLIAENIHQFRNYLPKGVTLVAISKTKPIEDIMEAYDAGHRDFGENKVQEMAEKAEKLPKDIRWHMVGHVQDNKVKSMAPFVSLVHGVDKEKRLKTINKEAAKNNRNIECLLQLHIAEEESKFGFSYKEAHQLLEKDLKTLYPNVVIRGVMGMATLTDDEPKIRNEFRGLKGFFDTVKKELDLPRFNIISMGMSNDYKIAIDEGSTMVRIGTSIFGKRDN